MRAPGAIKIITMWQSWYVVAGSGLPQLVRGGEDLLVHAAVTVAVVASRRREARREHVEVDVFDTCRVGAQANVSSVRTVKCAHRAQGLSVQMCAPCARS